jgi:tRNA threonylcarbamoyladenosine biosynthesis protein TsaE
MAFDVNIKTQSVLDTENVGEALAKTLLEEPELPRFVALFGDLGVGKTAFVRGFTKVIAPDARVKSPTFALVNEYRGAGLSVFHFDMYRIESEDDLYSIGFYDYADRNGICLTEWSENIEYALPEEYIRVEIVKDDAQNTDSRQISASYIGV